MILQRDLAQPAGQAEFPAAFAVRVPRLVEYFLRRYQRRSGRPEPYALDPTALALLCRHDWPGGVRELRSVVFGLARRCALRAHIYPIDIHLALPDSSRAVTPEALKLEAALIRSPEAEAVADSCRCCATA